MQPPAPPIPHSAIVLVVDGLRTDECTTSTASALTGVAGEEFASNLWGAIAGDGVVVRAIQNHGTTLTGPAHVQLLTGRLSDFINGSTDPSDPGLYLPSWPTLFELLRQQQGVPADQVQLITNSSLVIPATSSVYPGLGPSLGATVQYITTPSDPEHGAQADGPVLTALEETIEAALPRLAVLNLHEVDRTGHEEEVGEYTGSIQAVDVRIGEFWETLKRKHPDYVEQLLLVVTADHGRHRGAAAMYKEHGDACSGCREVPLFLAGGAVTARGEKTGYWDQLDLTATVAAWLGVQMPFGEGRPMTELVNLGAAAGSSGVVDVRAAGAQVVSRRLVREGDARSELLIDGIPFTGSGFYAESPAFASGAQDWLCYRALDPTPLSSRPWVPRCVREPTRDPRLVGFAVGEVGLAWEPQIRELDDGSLEVLYIENRLNIGAIGPYGSGPRITRLSPEGAWSEPFGPDLFVPTDARTVVTGGDQLVALGGSVNANFRYGRTVWVYRVVEPAWEVLANFGLDDLLDASPRVERPAIAYDGELVHLAMLGIDATKRVLAYTRSPDDGVTWSPAVALPITGAPYLHLSPAWDGDWLVWAEADPEGRPRFCRMMPEDAAPECLSVLAAGIDSFSVIEGGVVAAVDVGGGTWEVETFGW